VRTPLSERATKARRRRQERIYGFDRYVDASVIIKVVVSDPKGAITTPNGLRVREVNRYYRGGIIDTKASPPRLMPGRWIGPKADPLVWLVSEDQEPIVIHGDDQPRGAIVIGSMGAGKTTALAMWHFLRWIENCCDVREEMIETEDGHQTVYRANPREGLQTAPTLERLGLVKAEIDKIWRPNWMKWVDRDDFTGYEICDGCRLRFVSTYRQSAAQGSRVQGFNASWAGRDEMQDQVDEHEHIEARGRAAKFGGTYFKQLGTATAKDDADWRTLRDRLDHARGAGGMRLWRVVFLFGQRSPFISAEWWEQLKATMSERMYSMVVECRDMGPERATYSKWSRKLADETRSVNGGNMIRVPSYGWEDVTERELAASALNRPLLVGHDPGTLWHVSTLWKAYIETKNLQAYLTGKARPFWVCRGEVNSEQTTTEVHIDQLLNRVRPMHLNQLTHDGKPNPKGRQIMVRADPADTTEKTEVGTHKSVYTQFTNAGIHIKPAAYNAENDGHGKVPKDPGIEVIETLICNKAGERNFFVEQLPDGSPAAPKLVDAIESCKRDDRGKAETTRKGKYDKSHWTATARYALWAIERPRLQRMAQPNA
jgi:hypothetical protein